MPATKISTAPAAWALERMYPERYARRRPETIPIAQLRDVVHYLVEMAMQQASDTTNPKILRVTLTKLAHQSLARVRDQHR